MAGRKIRQKIAAITDEIAAINGRLDVGMKPQRRRKTQVSRAALQPDIDAMHRLVGMQCHIDWLGGLLVLSETDAVVAYIDQPEWAHMTG